MYTYRVTYEDENLYVTIVRAGVAEWQTRLFKGQVRKGVGSTPTACTIHKNPNRRICEFGFFNDYFEIKILLKTLFNLLKIDFCYDII